MSRRKTTLAECNPHWVIHSGVEGDSPDAVMFNCPEGHEDCKHIIPFTPALNGTPRGKREGAALWQRLSQGDDVTKLTLSPSIRRIQRYVSKEAALADGVQPTYYTESLVCALHIFVRNGQIEFCRDSK